MQKSTAYYIYGGLSLAVLTILLLNPREAAASAGAALAFCAKTLIPSLFPFMVISNLLSKGGGADLLGRLFARPVRLIFGLPGCAAGAIIVGFVCGFPSGTVCAVNLYEQGRLTRREFERLITFVNNPGFPFVVGTLGGMLSSRKYGIVVYASVISSALFVGVATRFFYRESAAGTEVSHPLPPSENHSVLSVVGSSLTAAASGMLSVSSSVVFFSTFAGVLSGSAFLASLPTGFVSLITGFFDISSGAIYASSQKFVIQKLCLSAAICSWSGLGVHAQIVTICRSTSAKGGAISFFGFFISKLVQAIVSPFIVLAFLYLGEIKSVCDSGKIPIIFIIFFAVFTIFFVIFRARKRRLKHILLLKGGADLYE